MILFFDTETTGIARFNLPANHPEQPHLVQIAAQLCEDDGRPIASFSTIVDPKVAIPDGAAAVHGITNEKAASLGISVEAAVQQFKHLYDRASLLVAHNIKFDRAIMEAAISRCLGNNSVLTKPMYCTMETASPIVNLPPTDRMRAAGFIKPKPPKLAECIKHFFGEELEDAHDAMVDLAACRRVYLHLKSLEAAA